MKTRRGEEVKRRKGAKAIRFAYGLFLLSLVAFTAGCGANEGILKSGKETPQTNAESSKSSFEKDLEAMRIADFVYV